MTLRDTVDQLRTLNVLFASTGAATSEQVEHIRRVLDFLKEKQEGGDAGLSFSDAADRLAQLYFGDENGRNLLFSHWNVPNDEYFNPLWIRKALITRMKRLAGASAAFLLITGLREAICPAGSYWTKKRQESYDCVCDYVNDLVCTWVAPDLRLQMVFF